ncbi:MAG TPA: hypothetical protein VGB89_06740 [Bacteroidota bacterium]
MSDEKIFKYKLDFYYQSAIIYLVTLILYGGIRGNIGEGKFEFILLGDPVMYFIVFFVLISFGSLILNYIRNRRLIIESDAIVFKNRFRERRICLKEIEWMHIGREAHVQTAGKFQVIAFKLKGKRRLFRIRLGRYERSDALLREVKKIAGTIPMGRRRSWRRPRNKRSSRQ